MFGLDQDGSGESDDVMNGVMRNCVRDSDNRARSGGLEDWKVAVNCKSYSSAVEMSGIMGVTGTRTSSMVTLVHKSVTMYFYSRNVVNRILGILDHIV